MSDLLSFAFFWLFASACVHHCQCLRCLCGFTVCTFLCCTTGQYHGEVDAKRMLFHVLFVIFVNANCAVALSVFNISVRLCCCTASGSRTASHHAAFASSWLVCMSLSGLVITLCHAWSYDVLAHHCLPPFRLHAVILMNTSLAFSGHVCSTFEVDLFPICMHIYAHVYTLTADVYI